MAKDLSIKTKFGYYDEKFKFDGVLSKFRKKNMKIYAVQVRFFGS